jgi:L-fuconolactonase
MAALRRDFLPDDLAPLLAAAGFDGCIAVQAEQSLAESDWLLELAAGHGFIRGVVGWVDLRDPGCGELLRRCAENPLFRGVRHVAQDEPDDRFLLRDDFGRGLAELEPLGLTYDVLVYARQLPAAVELVRRFPRQRFVLDHLGKPDIRGAGFATWRAQFRLLAEAENTCCKLSGLVTEADWSHWTPADFVPYLDSALESFGVERLMIGSDWPVCLLAGTYAETTAVVRDWVARLSDAERAAILGATAARFYGVGAAPHPTSASASSAVAGARPRRRARATTSATSSSLRGRRGPA